MAIGAVHIRHFRIRLQKLALELEEQEYTGALSIECVLALENLVRDIQHRTGKQVWPRVDPQANPDLHESVKILQLSPRAYKCLVRMNIHTIYDLTQCLADDLLERHNFGMISLNEIRAALATRGFTLMGESVPGNSV